MPGTCRAAAPQIVALRLNTELDQVIAEGRSGKTDIEQRVNAVGRAVADLDRERARPVAVPGPVTPLDRRFSKSRTASATPRRLLARSLAQLCTTRAATPSEALPRACTQELSGLEQQLRQINLNRKPQALRRRPGHRTLRDDLAHIGFMLQEAMPRKSVEAIEHEMRELADRIDHSRNAGADGAALASIERGLAEVRELCVVLRPAENDRGLIANCSSFRKRSMTSRMTVRTRPALRQLESAIIGLRGIVSSCRLERRAGELVR